ncbi:MAG: hypothetical protein ACXABV_20365, partial [Candidatus Thorarchaeota archaeon]
MNGICITGRMTNHLISVLGKRVRGPFQSSTLFDEIDDDLCQILPLVLLQEVPSIIGITPMTQGKRRNPVSKVSNTNTVQ